MLPHIQLSKKKSPHVTTFGLSKVYHIYSFLIKNTVRCTVLGETYKNPTRLLKKNIKTQNRYAAERKRKPTKRTIEKELQSVQMMEREKSEKKVGICHHQTTIPSIGIVSVFLYRRPAYSLHIQILFLQYERLKPPHHCFSYSNQNLKSSIFLCF